MRQIFFIPNSNFGVPEVENSAEILKKTPPKLPKFQFPWPSTFIDDPILLKFDKNVQLIYP